MRYLHTNLIARDWRSLAAFYEAVFGCERLEPERDYRGEALDAGTGVPGARLVGVHLRLPGHGPEGPTLEVYAYEPEHETIPRGIAQPGLGHLAFDVESVEAVRAQVLAAGGRAIGEVVELSPSPDRVIEWCYVTDPEGNAIEIQSTTRLDGRIPDDGAD